MGEREKGKVPYSPIPPFGEGEGEGPPFPHSGGEEGRSMATPDDMVQKIEALIERDTRYKKEAYFFLYAALDHTVRMLGRHHYTTERERHVTGRELLRGISEYGWAQYGPMTKAVFAHWGLTTTLDFGEMVFNLVKMGLMSKTDEDSLEDFRDVYDFDEEFDWKTRRGTIDLR
jgi:uncharacterized repeat protein (TIGR04138 family)